VNAANGSVDKNTGKPKDAARVRREPQVPKDLLTDIVFHTLRFFTWVVGVTLFRFRVTGRHNIPLKTGALIASNHQSYLDPVIIGAMARRRPGYLARESLWHGSRFFRFVITFLGAIPISIDSLGKDGVRLAVAYLKKRRHILVFPEGTRTRDGSVGPMSPGVKLIAELANVPIVPAALKGAFEMWPRGGKWTRIHPLSVGFAKRFEPEELRKMSTEEFRARLRDRIVKVYEKLP
jgi:1-acyl-sn-glycerol-3-phosphate acyltransferase